MGGRCPCKVGRNGLERSVTGISSRMHLGSYVHMAKREKMESECSRITGELGAFS